MLADGIYFGLPEEVYFAQQRLSATAIKQLRISAATFWADSWLNPNPKVLTEEQQRRLEIAKVLGRAYHCARLEADVFHDRFTRMLDKADFEGVEGFVAGGTAYSEALGALGETKKRAGESVAEQAIRLRDAGYTAGPIWDVELAQWERDKGERVAIPAVNWDEILQDMERIRGVPEIAALLSGGFAEVSVLWTDAAGVQWKTRLDYLRPDGWADFKTFANGNGKNVQQVIVESFRFNRYHLQAAIQRQAVELLRAGQLEVQQSPAEGFAAAHEMLEAITASETELRCDFVWQEKGGVPNLWAKRLRFHVPNGFAEAIAELEASGASEEHLQRAREMQRVAGDSRPQLTQWHRRALQEVDAAVRDFHTYAAVYQPGEPWLPFNPVGELTDADFPPRWLEGIE